MRIASQEPGNTDFQGAEPGDAVAAGYAHIVLGIVALAFDIPPGEILSPSRKAPVAFARQCAMYLLHVVFRVTQTCVGRVFGRDRTTATHACQVVENAREDGETDARLEAWAETLQAFTSIEPFRLSKRAAKRLAAPREI